MVTFGVALLTEISTVPVSPTYMSASSGVNFHPAVVVPTVGTSSGAANSSVPGTTVFVPFSTNTALPRLSFDSLSP